MLVYTLIHVSKRGHWPVLLMIFLPLSNNNFDLLYCNSHPNLSQHSCTHETTVVFCSMYANMQWRYSYATHYNWKSLYPIWIILGIPYAKWAFGSVVQSICHEVPRRTGAHFNKYSSLWKQFRCELPLAVFLCFSSNIALANGKKIMINTSEVDRNST